MSELDMDPATLPADARALYEKMAPPRKAQGEGFGGRYLALLNHPALARRFAAGQRGAPQPPTSRGGARQVGFPGLGGFTWWKPGDVPLSVPSPRMKGGPFWGAGRATRAFPALSAALLGAADDVDARAVG